jgi:hypothetical protein
VNRRGAHFDEHAKGQFELEPGKPILAQAKVSKTAYVADQSVQFTTGRLTDQKALAEINAVQSQPT